MTIDLPKSFRVAVIATAITGTWPTLLQTGETATSAPEVSKIVIPVDTTAGNITLAYVDRGFNAGTEYEFKKTSTDTFKIIFVDPTTGITLSFVDQKGEGLSLFQVLTGASSSAVSR